MRRIAMTVLPCGSRNITRYSVWLFVLGVVLCVWMACCIVKVVWYKFKGLQKGSRDYYADSDEVKGREASR